MNMREGALLAIRNKLNLQYSTRSNSPVIQTKGEHANTHTYSRHLFCVYSTWLHVFLIASLAQSSLHIRIHLLDDYRLSILHTAEIYTTWNIWMVILWYCNIFSIRLHRTIPYRLQFYVHWFISAVQRANTNALFIAWTSQALANTCDGRPWMASNESIWWKVYLVPNSSESNISK